MTMGQATLQGTWERTRQPIGQADDQQRDVAECYFWLNEVVRSSSMGSVSVQWWVGGDTSMLPPAHGTL